MRPYALILLQDLMRSLGYPSQEIARLARYLGQLNCGNMMKPIFILQSLATSSLEFCFSNKSVQRGGS